MASEFSREFFSANRIVKADLHCARQPREQDLDKIKAELKSLYDATEVLLDVSVDESLLSGYVLQVGDRVFDNSGRHALDQMTGDKPDLATLKTRVEDYKPAANTAEGGTVVSAADGIVTVEGMDRAVYGEIVTFENGAKGMVESVEPSHLGIMLFDGAESVGVGTLVTRTGKLRRRGYRRACRYGSPTRWASPSTARVPSKPLVTTPSRSRPPAFWSARAWTPRCTPAFCPSTRCSPSAVASVS